MDPLQYFLTASPPDFSLVENYVTGDLYRAVMLRNGNIGVCATLGHSGPVNLASPSLSDPGFRSLLIAYYNAVFNGIAKVETDRDIYADVDFTKMKNLVMIGFFRPLVAKFDRDQIPLQVFDIEQDDPRLTEYHKIENALSNADQVIITSTTLVNNTFNQLIERLPEHAEAYMLGPSGILHPYMLRYKNVKAVYGMQIPAFQAELPDIIAHGGGTPEFSKLTTKVVLRNI